MENKEMKNKENIKMNVLEKLSMARVKLQEAKLNKSGKNPYAGFKYFELADFLPLVNKIFMDMRLCSSLRIDDGTVAVLKIFNAETSQDDYIEFSCPFSIPDAKLNRDGKEILDKMQRVGSAITYVRRYLYMMALEIVESDLLDATCYGDDEASSIDKITTLKGLNEAFEKLGKSSMSPDLKRRLWNKAKKIGSCFSTDEGCFVTA